VRARRAAHSAATATRGENHESAERAKAR